MNVPYLIADLIRRGNLQEWVNCRFKEPRAVVLDRRDIDYIVTKDGLRFVMSPDVHCATSIYWRYRFDDILPHDHVIDLGANVGGFAILASRYTDEPVMAVEPVRAKILRDNIVLNNAPVCAYEYAISPEGTTKVTWREQTKEVPCMTLGQAIHMNGGCDFLKMDIEGAEWSINPSDLDNVRRIEGQLHMPYVGFKHPLIDYLKKNYMIWWQSNKPPRDRPCLPMYGHLPTNPVFHALRRNLHDD